MDFASWMMPFPFVMVLDLSARYHSRASADPDNPTSIRAASTIGFLGASADLCRPFQRPAMTSTGAGQVGAPATAFGFSAASLHHCFISWWEAPPPGRTVLPMGARALHTGRGGRQRRQYITSPRLVA